MSHYVFDRELRLLVLDAIERVEVSLRTQWAYHLSHKGGSHAYLDPTFAYNKRRFEENLRHLRNEVRRSKEIFIKHYRKTYVEPQLPPIWSVCEVMSIGTLSRWFKNLEANIQREIAKIYMLPNGVLASFLHHISYVRNRCAHHCRLWNSKFTLTLKLPRTKPNCLATSLNPHEERKLYNSLVMLKWFMDIACPGHQWQTRLFDLIDEYLIDPNQMGFPTDYQARVIWLNS